MEDLKPYSIKTNLVNPNTGFSMEATITVQAPNAIKAKRSFVQAKRALEVKLSEAIGNVRDE